MNTSLFHVGLSKQDRWNSLSKRDSSRFVKTYTNLALTNLHASCFGKLFYQYCFGKTCSNLALATIHESCFDKPTESYFDKPSQSCFDKCSINLALTNRSANIIANLALTNRFANLALANVQCTHPTMTSNLICKIGVRVRILVPLVEFLLISYSVLFCSSINSAREVAVKGRGLRAFIKGFWATSDPMKM